MKAVTFRQKERPQTRFFRALESLKPGLRSGRSGYTACCDLWVTVPETNLRVSCCDFDS